MVFQMTHILGDDADSQARRLLGGKGAMLNELAGMRYPVPHGFVITTKAFDYYLDSIPCLRDSLVELSNSLSKENLQAALAITNSVHEQLISGPLPGELMESFYDAFAGLGLNAVAVRSSAVAEDGHRKSFAGIYDSVLNVGRTSLATAVRQVFASAVSSRVLSYQPSCLPSPGFAVVVHAMVDADISGVCYTRATADLCDEQMRIEAVFGLGEPLLAGELVPDCYVLDRQSTRVETIRHSAQPRRLALPDSTDTPPTWVEVDEAWQMRPKLDDAQCQEVANLALDLEKLFEMPCDVEWAIAHRRVFALQCRPLTRHLTDTRNR